MPSNQNLLHLHARRDIFESPRRYEYSESDFLQHLRAVLPNDWRAKREQIWLHCFGPACRPVPPQGWKIHVSALVSDANEVLERVALTAVQHATHFKCAQDRRTLGFLNSKLWSRGGFGKFLTIYPCDQEVFLVLLEELSEKLRSFQGPYILSDRQYRDSRIVFYRYGGMLNRSKLRADGSSMNVIETPTGELVEDVRTPFYAVPEWVEDPFPETQEEGNDDAPLQGRFQPFEALHFTAAGGTYLATDLSDASTVVLKESRPNVLCAPTGADTTSFLKREYEILYKIDGLEVGPKPIAFFEEGNHTFLAESLIAGESLRSQHGLNPLIVSRPSDSVYTDYGRLLQSIFEGLADTVSKLHRHGVVHGDVSPNNVIVHDETGTVRLIDFEASWIPGFHEPTKTTTAGFSLPHAVRYGISPFLNDLFGVGAVIAHCMFPAMALFEIAPEKRDPWVTNLVADLRLSQGVADLLIELFNCRCVELTQADVRYAFEGRLKITGAHVQHVVPLDNSNREPELEKSQNEGAYDKQECDDVADAVVEYIHHEMDFSRPDTVVPSDSKVFSTNPVSLAYGSAGVAWCLHQLTGRAPLALLDWTEAHLASERLPPGLLMGRAGVAVALSLCGRTAPAKDLISTTLQSDLLLKEFGLFHGCSGVGLACLSLYEITRDDFYLTNALEIGERILTSSLDGESDPHWPGDGAVAIGLGHGNAGIALFLLYLYVKTRDSRYITMGHAALQRDLKNSVEEPNGAISFSRSLDEPSPAFPYVEWGSAGIGQVVARYWKVTSERLYSEWLGRLITSVDRKYSVASGMNMGMAGVGAFLIDVETFAPGFDVSQQLKAAIHAVTRLRVARKVGTAFPIGATFRLSCDLANGSAGVALFLRACNHRDIATQVWPDSILRGPLLK